MFSENLYLTSDTARSLYEKYAKHLPIIDFHCHLSPKELCENRCFSNIGELWLAHDHYKWRAMRAFGIDEELITGCASWRDKFCAFAEIMPELAGNPLYIWCALELKRYFDIDEPLCKRNANKIYDQTAAMIAERNMTPSYFIKHSNVEYIATTDDPADDLAWHRQIAGGGAGAGGGGAGAGGGGAGASGGTAENVLEGGEYGKCRIVPAFRPDKAMGIEKPGFAAYIKSLGKAAGIRIKSFNDLIEALEIRLIAFKDAGAALTDTALTGFIWADYKKKQVKRIFKRALETDTKIIVATKADAKNVEDIYGATDDIQDTGEGESEGENVSESENVSETVSEDARTVASLDIEAITCADAGAGAIVIAGAGAEISIKEINIYRSAFLFEMANLYAKHGFTAQYHIGAYRNANSAMFDKLGPDTGYDSVDDAAGIRSFGILLDRLNSAGCLPRTIIYPLDINQYEAFATLAGNFCARHHGSGGLANRHDVGGIANRLSSGSRGSRESRGWVQLGAPWWFNDQYYGITKQFESIGSLYPVALSIGMLTDSRSILSYPRHELYRRALCNYLGNLVDRGEYFSCEEALGKIIRAVCYKNAKEYLFN